MYQFGPYGANHATAATFAFRKELLNQTKFDENSCVAEEKKFLKDYTIPFVQLESSKSILVFSHSHNSFDKKELLKQIPNPTINESLLRPSDIIKEQDILHFFMEDIDKLLESYEPGNPDNKPDVKKQIIELKEKREILIKESMQKQMEYKNAMQKLNLVNNPQELQNKINEQTYTIQMLMTENNQLKDKVKYFENKISEIIKQKKTENSVDKK